MDEKECLRCACPSSLLLFLLPFSLNLHAIIVKSCIEACVCVCVCVCVYSRLIPAPKILAVGRNYVAHAKELGNAVPTEPWFFLKPSSSLLLPGQGPMELPPQCKDLHFETELGVLIGRGGRDISEDDALNYVSGYVLALDMTARDLQEEAKQKRLPWTAAKGFDTFCPISSPIPKSAVPDPQNVELKLTVGGTVKQHGNTKSMIFSVARQIAAASRMFTLFPVCPVQLQWCHHVAISQSVYVCVCERERERVSERMSAFAL